MGPEIPVGEGGGGQQLEDVLGHVRELRLAPVCVGAPSMCLRWGTWSEASWVR